LPQRLTHCIDDLSYYKKDTDQPIWIVNHVNSEAREVLEETILCEQRLKTANNELLMLHNELTRFYRASISELYECAESELEVIRMRCLGMENKLSDIENMTLSVEQVNIRN
uniref:Tektin n=1 Tax=Gongylonema pulchrum TaxID=637853 RepID=A0A183EHN9_9BILA